MLDHIRRIKPPTEADFQQDDIRRIARKQQQAGRRGDFEYCNWRAGIGALAFLQRRCKFVVGHEPALTGCPDPKAFVETHQMRRGVGMYTLARSLQSRAQKSDCRPLAVGPGNMDHRRQFFLRVIERSKKTLDAIERQVDALWMQRGQPRNNRVDGRHNYSKTLLRHPRHETASLPRAL